MWKELAEHDLYMSFVINCFLKITQVQECLLHFQHTGHQLSLDVAGLRLLVVDSVNSSSDYFGYVCVPASETTFHPKRVSIVDRCHLQR
jgi:hypothetical protein